MSDLNKTTYLPEEMAEGLHFAFDYACKYADVSRTIDAGNRNTYDISLRQINADEPYDQIWLINIERNRLVVSHCDLDKAHTKSSEWVDDAIEEQAIDAAIEFDGWWYLRPSEFTYTLVTDEAPWVFWVSTDYVLYAQYGLDASTRIVLDEEVASISACRGFSSNEFPDRDQGLVVAYVKNGLPCYAQYIYDIELEGKRWTSPEQLCDVQGVLSIRSHRLNDFRIGFEMSTYRENIWAYTTRTYVSQKLEIIVQRVSESELTMFLYASKDDDISVECTSDISDDYCTLFFHITKPIRYFYSWRDVLAFDPVAIPDEQITDVEIVNSETAADIIVHLSARPKKLITSVTLNPSGRAAVQAKIKDCGYVIVPKTVFEFDTTIYRRLDPIFEIVGIHYEALSDTIKYSQLQNIQVENYSEIANIRPESSGLLYDAVAEVSLEMCTEIADIKFAESGIQYLQVETFVL